MEETKYVDELRLGTTFQENPRCPSLGGVEEILNMQRQQ